MDRNLAEFIIKACENNDSFFGWGESIPQLREGYSGRGMYGRETTGIVCDDVIPVLAAVANEVSWMDSDDISVDLSKLAQLGTDSLGRRIILY